MSLYHSNCELVFKYHLNSVSPQMTKYNNQIKA